MGNRVSKIAVEKECLICWETIECNNNYIYVKCAKCKIYLHATCAYSYYVNKCPHCQCIGSLYYYNDENCYAL